MNLPSTLPYQTSKQIYLWVTAFLISILLHLLFFIHYQPPVAANSATDKGKKGIEIGLKKIYQPPAPPKPKPAPQTPKSVIKKQPQPAVKKKPKPVVITTPKVDPTPIFTETTTATTEVTQQTPATPAPPSTFGDGNPDIKAAYKISLAAWLERYQSYPSVAKRRGQQGRVEIEFTIDQDGNVLSQKIITPSPFNALNKATLKMLKRANPLPPVPRELRQGRSTFTYTVPVAFLLK